MIDIKYFDPDKLAAAMENDCPEVLFVLLHGSTAESGLVKPGSDIDIAVYLDRPIDLDLYSRIASVVSRATDDIAEPDIGILNKEDPVYRFEALTGRLLFTRDDELYHSFFSLTCREYESQLVDYEIQRKYRLEYNRSA
ncbi:MAG: nucleotidyltransferase domain-containing protein [Victivallaceae bacterium]|nr:nucleotidyltransferase domain-containing protein [Victivallaceae bacterium]